MKIGQYISQQLSMGEDVVLDLKDKSIIFFNTETNQQQVKLSMQQDVLVFQTYNTQIQEWNAPVALTPTVTSDLSQTLPHSPTGQTYLEINDQLFKILIQNQQKLVLENNVLTLDVDSIFINNIMNNLNIKMDFSLGQKFRLIDMPELQEIFSISNTNIDLKNKPILNIIDDNDPNSVPSKAYVDAQIGGTAKSLQAIYNSIPSSLSIQNTDKFQQTAQPTTNSDLVNKLYADMQVDLKMNKTKTLNQIATDNLANGDIDINNFQLYNVSSGGILASNVMTVLDGQNKNYIHDSAADNTRIECSSTQIDLKTNNISIGNIKNDNNNMQINALQTLALMSQGNSIQIQDSQTADQLALQVSQTAGNNKIAIIQAGTEDSNVSFGAVSNFTTGLPDVSNAYFVQNLGQHPHAMVFSCGQALVDNSFVAFSDTISSTYPLQTQFTRKTGYQPSANVQITENEQFVTKQYADNSISQLHSVSGNTKIEVSDTNNKTTFTNDSVNTLNIIPTGIQPQINIDMNNSQKIINLADATQDTDALNRQTGDGRYYLNTTSLDSITAAQNNVSLNFQKITDLADPSLLTDAVNKQFADNNYYLNTTTLDNIAPPSGDLFMNSRKITNLLDPTLAQDASTKNYIDTRTINDLSSQTADYSTNSHKITNLANATLATDALNRQTGDGRYYLNTTALNSITTPSADLSLNSHKITNLSDPTLSQDAVTLNYLQNNITAIQNKTANPGYSKIDCSSNNQIDITSNNNHICKIYNAIGQTPNNSLVMETDSRMELVSDYNSISLHAGATQQVSPTVNVHGVYVQGNATNTVNQNITQLCIMPGDSVGQNLTLASSILGGQPVSTIINQSGTGQVSSALEITAGATVYPQAGYDPTLIMYSRSFGTSIGAAQNMLLTDPIGYLNPTQTITANGQLASKYYADTQDNLRYLATTPLNSITTPSADLSLNSKKIINLANATLATDALNRQTGDGRYYLNTTTLNSIVAPTGSVSLNSQKITNLLNPTLVQDAATKNYVDTAIAGFNSAQIQSTSTNTKINVSDIGNVTTFTNNSINTLNINPTTILPQVNIDMNNSHKITNLPIATNPSDAVRFDQITGGSSINPEYIILNAATQRPANGSKYLDSHWTTKTLTGASSLLVYNSSNGSVSLFAGNTYRLSLSVFSTFAGSGYYECNIVRQSDNVYLGTLLFGQQKTFQSESISADLSSFNTPGPNYSILVNITSNIDISLFAVGGGAIASDLNLVSLSVERVISGFINNATNSLSGISSSFLNTASVDMNNQKIINASNPSGNLDVVNLQTLNTYIQNSTSANACPVGQIISYYADTIPSGWLLCDGSVYNTLTYPDLFTFLGVNTVPDLRGYFLRGKDPTGLVDVDGAGTRIIGSTQADAFKSHLHSYQDAYFAESHGGTTQSSTVYGTSASSDTDNKWYFRTRDGTYSANLGDANTFLDSGSTGNSETRPKNKVINFLIRAANFQQLVIVNTANSAIQISDLTNVTTLTATVSSLNANQVINMNSNKILNVAIPTASTDAATKQYVDNASPVGSMTMFAAETSPTNWLECNGSAVSRTTYATLFAIIGTNWGNGNGTTTFNLPDTRGMFPRGWNHSTATASPYNDPDAASRVATNSGGLTGDRVGTKQGDQFASHTHTYSRPNSSASEAGFTGSHTGIETLTTGIATGSAGGNETRAVNFGVMFIIKYQWKIYILQMSFTGILTLQLKSQPVPDQFAPINGIQYTDMYVDLQMWIGFQYVIGIWDGIQIDENNVLILQQTSTDM